MTFPLNATLGLRKRIEGEKDAHGNAKVTYADAVEIKVYGYGPRSSGGSSEPSKPNRDEVVIGQTVYAPPEIASQVTALDRFEVPLGGDVYEVDGEIGDWNHGPFGWQPGISIALKRVEG